MKGFQPTSITPDWISEGINNGMTGEMNDERQKQTEKGREQRVNRKDAAQSKLCGGEEIKNQCCYFPDGVNKSRTNQDTSKSP